MIYVVVLRARDVTCVFFATFAALFSVVVIRHNALTDIPFRSVPYSDFSAFAAVGRGDGVAV